MSQSRIVAPANTKNPCPGIASSTFPRKDLLGREIADKTKNAGKAGWKKPKGSSFPEKIDGATKSMAEAESEYSNYEYSDYEYIPEKEKVPEKEKETSDDNVFEEKFYGKAVKKSKVVNPKLEVTKTTYGDLHTSTTRIKPSDMLANNESNLSSLRKEEADEEEAANEVYFESSESDYSASNKTHFDDRSKSKVLEQIETLHNRVEKLEEKLFSEVEKLKRKISASK
jgi:hypothetical protein